VTRSLTELPNQAPDDIPAYPMPRAQRCPLDPPPALSALRSDGPMTRVRLWDGSTPWLVTRYAEQRALLSDPRVSADTTREGYPYQSESLRDRYLSIVHSGRRRVAVGDIEVAGQVIRAGEGIVMPNEIANRDAEMFPDPEGLDVHRDARGHLAFGFGVHQCLGQPLARVELQVVYGTLYRRVPSLALAADPAQIPFKHDGVVYGVYELPVTW